MADLTTELVDVLEYSRDNLKHTRCVDDDASKCPGCSAESQIDTILSRIRSGEVCVVQLLGAIKLAVLFHDTYERLAPQYGYETRQETRLFNAATPNGKLMIAVCRELRDTLAASAEDG